MHRSTPHRCTIHTCVQIANQHRFFNAYFLRVGFTLTNQLPMTFVATIARKGRRTEPCHGPKVSRMKLYLIPLGINYSLHTSNSPKIRLTLSIICNSVLTAMRLKLKMYPLGPSAVPAPYFVDNKENRETIQEESSSHNDKISFVCIL